MCFLCLRRGGKTCRKTRQRAIQKKKKWSFPRSEGCLGLFIAPKRILRLQAGSPCHLQTSSDGYDLDISGKVLTSCFWKGMDLENPMVISKVMALGGYPSFRDILIVLTPIQPMNSHWNKNLIIFKMALVLTRSDGHIKIRVFRLTRDCLRVKLGRNC